MIDTCYNKDCDYNGLRRKNQGPTDKMASREELAKCLLQCINKTCLAFHKGTCMKTFKGEMGECEDRMLPTACSKRISNDPKE